MAEGLKNIANALKDSRVRTILVFTGTIILIAVAIAIIEFRSKAIGPEVKVGVNKAPATMQSIPGGFEQPETQQYISLQTKENIIKAQMAEKTGKSAIPTITGSQDVTGGAGTGGAGAGTGINPNQDWQAGLGFSTLSRTQEGQPKGLNGTGTGTGGTGTGQTGVGGAGTNGLGTSGTGTSGLGTSGTGTSGTGTSGTGLAGASGTSGAGTGGLGRGTAGAGGIGTSGLGKSGLGTSGAGIGTSGTGTSGTGLAGASGLGTSGTGTSGLGTAGTGGLGTAGTGGLGTAGGAGTGGLGNAGTGGPAGLGAPTGIGDQANNLSAIAQRQAAQLSAAQLEQLRQQLQAAMSAQANQLLASAWNAPTQQYVAGNPPAQATAQGGGAGGAGGAGGTIGGGAVETPLFKAGTILFGVLDTAVNTDEPGPVMATIVDGPYKGSKLLGTITNQGQKVMLTFNLFSIAGSPKSISINAVAIDTNTARTALSSNTDNHILLRYGTLFASAFIQGYGQAFSQSGQTITSNGLQTNTTNPDLSADGKFYVALGNVGSKWSAATATLFNRPPTVHVYSGTGIGVLILADVSPSGTS